MSYFTWSPAFSIGLKKIDQQHKSLVQAVNALHEGLHAGKGSSDLGWILNFLGNYTAEHFQTEEDLMVATAFPNQEAHMRIHRELLGQVGAFIGRYQSGSEDISQELLDFLKQWLLVHIGEEDVRLGAHAQQHQSEAGKGGTPGPGGSPVPARIPPVVRPPAANN